MKRKRKNIFYWILLIVFFVSLLYLFDLSLSGTVKGHDAYAHYLHAIADPKVGYSLNNWVIYFLCKNGNTIFLQFFLAVCVLLTLFSVNYLLSEENFYNNTEYDNSLIKYISIIVVFIKSLYLPVLHPYFYRWQYNASEWHNDTLITMRLFAVISLIFWNKIVRKMGLMSKNLSAPPPI